MPKMSANSGATPAQLILEFTQHLAESLASGTFIRLVLSGAPTQPGSNAPERIFGRCIDLGGEPHLSLTLSFRKRDEVCNLKLAKAAAWVGQRIGAEFRAALLGTTLADWQLSLAPGKRPRLIRHPASASAPPDRRHDQRRQGVLDDSAQDWLYALGVTDGRGKVRSGMIDKYAQINRYLEVFTHLAKEIGWNQPSLGISSAGAQRPITGIDLGSGKAYLTFGLWHLWRRVWQMPVQILGVEARADLVATTCHVAETIQARELQFVCGTIEQVDLPPADALIALHACDTATDHALRRGVELGASLILLAPCCHKEVRSHLTHPAPLAPVLRHGLMEERMAEWVTDGLRALFLEWAGYRTKLFEFVSPEHTGKNLMIAAMRDGPAFVNHAAAERIERLKGFFGIRNHTLDPLLAGRVISSSG